MTDTSNQQIDSPISSNDCNSNNMESQSMASSNRRSQRRRIVSLKMKMNAFSNAFL